MYQVILLKSETQFARDVADRVLLFRDGRIQADGLPTDLL